MLDDMWKEFYDIGKSLSSEKDTLRLFEKIINSSMRLTLADAGTIYIVVDKKTGEWSNIKNGSVRGKLLKFVIARNRSMEVNLQDNTAPVSRKSIFGFAVVSGNSLRIDDAYEIGSDVEYKHNHSFDSSTGYRTKSMLTIPMKNHDNDITGVIQLINKKKSWDTILDYKTADIRKEILPFNDTDEMIMNSLAGQAAVALENSHLYKSMQDLLQVYKQQNIQLQQLSRNIMKAHEEERKRIAREIHDGPAQAVVNLSLKLEICRKYLSISDTDRLASGLNDLGESIRSSVKEIRTIIYDLKPAILEDGLILAIQKHIEAFSTSNDLRISFDHTGDDSVIEYYLTSTIFRIVQEALSNARKHAQASSIRVKLAVTASGIAVDIADNGKGFVVEEMMTRKYDKRVGGFGIQGIRERLELVGGSLDIRSAPGRGTSLRIEIPLL